MLEELPDDSSDYTMLKVENVVLKDTLTSLRIHIQRPLSTGDAGDYDFLKSPSTNMKLTYVLNYDNTGVYTVGSNDVVVPF